MFLKVFDMESLSNLVTLRVHSDTEYGNYVTSMCTKNDLFFAAGPGYIRVHLLNFPNHRTT